MLDPSPPPLLAADEPPPFTVLHPEATRPLLLLCDHASHRLPRVLGDLGVSETARLSHIGWDPGAAAVCRLLADRFQATAILSSYSRLVVDLNRAPGDPSAIPAVSDHLPIPGNQGLSEAEAKRRTEALFWPYHHEVAERIAHLWRLGRPPIIVSIHSCVPAMDGQRRPWHIGLMYNHDDRVTRAMLAALSGRRPWAVLGENQPYSGKDIGFTVNTHAEPAGLPSLGVEFRQDLVTDAAGIADWAALFGDALAEVLEDDALATCRMV